MKLITAFYIIDRKNLWYINKNVKKSIFIKNFIINFTQNKTYFKLKKKRTKI